MPKIPVTFRIERGAHAVLLSAAQRAGLNTSNFIEETVLEKLADTETLRTSEELEGLRHQIEALRSDLAVATEAILVVTGSQQSYSPEQAKKFVSDRLRRTEKETS